MIILKLGGSVITHKESIKPRINFENLERIASEIANASPPSLIIVHGAGSFGHPFAKEYGIGSPILGDEEFKKRRIGFSITQRWVKQLNIYVCDALREKGIPAVSIQPSSSIIATNGRITTSNLGLIIQYLNGGFVPVLHGDVVLDTNKKVRMSVISGDQIIKYLGENLTPKRVIVGTDVNGVFDKNPKIHPDARLLKIIKSPKDIKILTETPNADVTGAMIGKIKELLLLAEKGIKSRIINATIPGNVEKALLGQEVKGTIIEK